jgi:hypothetical protein
VASSGYSDRFKTVLLVLQQAQALVLALVQEQVLVQLL